MMELMYANRIRSVRNTLVETIKPEDVAHKLWILRCISKKEKDKLIQIKGQHGHNSMLIDLLLSKNPTQCVLEKFVGVLEDTANVGVAHLIQHEISDKAVLSKHDKNQLQKHHYDFVSGMEMAGVIRILSKEPESFSVFEMQELQSKRTNKDRAEYLMSQMISRGSYRQLRLLKKALLQTGQSTLASYLPLDSEQDELDGKGGELVAKGHSVHYSEGKSEHSLHMNSERQRSEQADAGYGESLPKDSGIGESADFRGGEKVVFHDDMSVEATNLGKGFVTLDRKPTVQEVNIARKLIFGVIDNKDFTPYDFWEKLTKFKKMNYITPVNLISDEGLNILQACIEKGRLSFLIHIVHIGWWKILAGQKVPEDSSSEHKGKTAKQIAESKKARKPLDEFNIHNEWEGSMSPLMRACRTGDVSRVKSLLESSAMETFHTDYNQGNSIYWAIVHGSLELVTLLEKEGLNIKMQTKKKETLLHLACTLGHSHLVQPLVKTYKIDHILIDTSHKTPQDRVSENGDIESLKMFEQCDIPPKPNAPALAAFAGRTSFLAHLFGPMNVSVESKDMYNRTALHRSCESGKVATVKYLLSRGADVMAVTSMGRNVLHIIAENGNMELLNMVLSIVKSRDMLHRLLNVQDRYNGVDLCFLIRGRDKGRDAWHYVEVERNQVPIFLKKTKCGNVDVAKFGDVIKSGWGVNPDQDAVDDIEEIFKRRRLNQNALKDQTPLHIAVAKGNFEVAKVLIDHGANLNIQDKFGLTPILLATSKGHLETVTLLENRGADYSIVDRKGLGIKEIADQNEHEQIVNYSKGRDYTHYIANFLSGPLNDVERSLENTVLRRIQDERGDCKSHVAESMRTVSTKINSLLQKLDSGPVSKETVCYKAKMVVPTNNRDKVTTMLASVKGTTSVMNTGSYDSGYHSEPGSSIHTLVETSLRSELLDRDAGQSVDSGIGTLSEQTLGQAGPKEFISRAVRA